MYSSRNRARLREVNSKTPAAAISVDFSLQQIGAVDGEQRLPRFDVVPNRGIKRDDPPLVGGENLHRHVLIEIDTADRFLLDRKSTLFNRLDFDRSEL